MTAVSTNSPAKSRTPSEALLEELVTAYGEVRGCIAELEGVLAQPRVDRARLTTIRLSLARLRLERGPLVSRLAGHLAGRADIADAALVQQLRASHQELFQAAANHTRKWTLDAIENDWAGYKAATRRIVDRWLKELEADQQMIFPLLRHP